MSLQKKIWLLSLTLLAWVSIALAATTQIPIKDYVSVVKAFLFTDDGSLSWEPLISLNADGQWSFDVPLGAFPDAVIEPEDTNFEIQRPIDIICQPWFVKAIKKDWKTLCRPIGVGDLVSTFDQTYQRRVNECPSGQFITSVAQDGSVTCQWICNEDVIISRSPAPPEVMLASQTATWTTECGTTVTRNGTLDFWLCPTGQYLQWFWTWNAATCVSWILIQDGWEVCLAWELLQGFDVSGNIICVPQCVGCE